MQHVYFIDKLIIRFLYIYCTAIPGLSCPPGWEDGRFRANCDLPGVDRWDSGWRSETSSSDLLMISW